MYVHETQVTASHVGVSGYQTTMSVLSMMQDCSQLWFDAAAEINKYLIENSIVMIMTSRQVDFIKKAPYRAMVTVKTGVFDCNGFTGSRNTALYDSEGSPYAISWSTGLFINRETGKPARVPKWVLELLSLDEKLGMDYQDKRITLPDSTPQIHSPVTAMRSDIDFNQHVNNTHYVRMAGEFLPEGFDYKRLRVEYKLAAVLGDKLIPFVYNEDSGTITIALMSEQEKPFALVEYSLLQG